MPTAQDEERGLDFRMTRDPSVAEEDSGRLELNWTKQASRAVCGQGTRSQRWGATRVCTERVEWRYLLVGERTSREAHRSWAALENSWLRMRGRLARSASRPPKARRATVQEEWP